MSTIICPAILALAGGYADDPCDRRYRRRLGILVHDHIIVGKNGHARFRTLKLIPLSAITKRGHIIIPPACDHLARLSW
jgi:hypothetical protein